MGAGSVAMKYKLITSGRSEIKISLKIISIYSNRTSRIKLIFYSRSYTMRPSTLSFVLASIAAQLVSAIDSIPKETLVSYNPDLWKCDAVYDGWGYCVQISGTTPLIIGGGMGGGNFHPTTMATSVKPAPTPVNTVLQPAKPEEFPPKRGQAYQCVPEALGKRAFTAIGSDLTNGVEQACNQIISGGDSKWLAKGNAYVGTAKVFSSKVFYEIKIWQGGFSFPRDLCVKQLNAAINQCHFQNGVTFGGCSYSEDGNVQACFFPSLNV
ncbi:hypothetical protein AA313_de0206227 [Arthrobotrys entomopaga]|nr:hypothetical protein AA313_de0206227 [Arthrobotrys entomopaga]